MPSGLALSELLRGGRSEFSTDIHRAHGNGNGRCQQRTMQGTADPWASSRDSEFSAENPMRHRPKRCSGHPQRRRVRHHYVRRLTCFTAPLPSRSNQQLVSDRTDGPPKVLTGAGPPPPDLDRTAHTSERTRPVGRHATADVGPPTHRGQGLRCGRSRTPRTALAAPRAYGFRRNCRYLRRRQIQAHRPGGEGSAGQPSATSQPRRPACGLRHEDVQASERGRARGQIGSASSIRLRPRSWVGSIPGRRLVRSGSSRRRPNPGRAATGSVPPSRISAGSPGRGRGTSRYARLRICIGRQPRQLAAGTAPSAWRGSHPHRRRSAPRRSSARHRRSR